MTCLRRVIINSFLLVLAMIAMLALPASAQVTTGTITGVITDTQGKVIPGATVTVTNRATGASRSANANGAGEYSIEAPAGTYDITVEAPSFSKAVAQNFELNVGAKVTQGFQLKPGEVTATVQVTADTVPVETTKSAIGGVVTSNEVQNLPLINRTFANLATIIPEARPASTFDPTKTHVGTIAFSGGDGRQVDVNVDGGDNKDNVVGSLLQNFAYESIQEFQVAEHRWTAESGRSVGGVVNVITKSGTNALHGSGFFDYRGKGLRAKDFFESRDNLDKPDFNREQFGGSVGGPIKKDKLFFFGAVEHFRERQGIALTTEQINQINAIPGITASPVIPIPYNDTMFTVKVDHNISHKSSMNYRYSFQKNDSPNDQVDPGQPSDLAGGNTNNNKLHSFVVNHTYTLSPTKVNAFTFQFQSFENDILGVTTNPNLLFPSVQSGANVNVPQQTIERKFQFRDDFSWQKEKHNIKFGVNYIHTKLEGFFFFGANGYQILFFDDPLTIQNNLPSINCPGSTATNLVKCYPQGFSTPGAVNEIDFNTGAGDTTQPPFHQLAFYVQDDYRVTPKLTLNLGLRWDANINMLVDQTNNRTMQLLKQLTTSQRAQAITGGDLARRTTSWKEFQPRIGFAWDPKGDGRSVVRGGYGIFFDQIFQNLTLFSTQQTNPTIYQTALSPSNSRVGVGDLATFVFGTTPLPTPPPGFSPTDLTAGSFGRINDPTLQDPYVQKFSIGFETKLGQKYTLSTDYVHTIGIHENRVLNINPRIRNICNSSWPGSDPSSPLCVRTGSAKGNTRFFDAAFVAAGLGAGRLEQINMFASNNRSFYDSWITTLRRRSRKMMYSISYVLSDSRSWGGQPVASYSGNGIAITPEQQFQPEEFGPTRIDERHRIVASGVFDLPYGFQLSPIFQLASARPYSPIAGTDLDGDGRSTVDRICSGVDPLAVLQALVNGSALPAGTLAKGCTQAQVNSVRGGFAVNGTTITSLPGRYFNVDLRLTKSFSFGEKWKLKGFLNFYNLFNTTNLAFAERRGLSNSVPSGGFLQPVSLFGPGFGPPVGVPFTMQIGVRVDF